MTFYPCFLCAKKLDLRISKTEKPYFICDDCGVQIFFRRKKGIELLHQLLDKAKKQLGKKRKRVIQRISL
jgi:DNA-directed RNA polymerase subunit RPC12/RpoP